MINDNSQPALRNAAALLQFNPPPTAGNDDGPVALIRWLGTVIYQHKLKFAVCLAAGIGFGIYYAQSVPRTYSATASLLLEPHRQAGVVVQDLAAQGLDLNRADSELQIIRSERLLTTVFDSLHLESLPELGPRPEGFIKTIATSVGKYILGAFSEIFPGLHVGSKTIAPASATDGSNSAAINARQIAFLNFSQNLSARRVGQSYVIEIEYSSYDPKLAATVANAAVSAYMLQAVSFKSQMAVAGTEALQWRIDALAAQVDAARNAVRLGTLPTLATPDADARIIGAALEPLNPSGPPRSLTIAFGGILGLLAASALVAVSSTFSRRIRDGKILSRETGVAFLGTLPAATGVIDTSFQSDRQQGSASKSTVLSPYAIAIRNVRTSIEIVCSNNRKKRGLILAVASLDRSGGSAPFCSNLTQLISHSGRKVTFFAAEYIPNAVDGGDTPSKPGLADILTANLSADEYLRQETTTHISRLNIYSANADANLFADFRDRRVANIVEAASAGGDVVIELPALSNSSDALAIAAHADVVVIVVKAGKTKVDQVTDAIEQFRRTGANVIGTVISR